jgi:predicted nucleotidyltransferase
MKDNFTNFNNSNELAPSFDEDKFNDLKEGIETRIDEISQQIFAGEINITDSALEMVALTREVVSRIAEELASLLGVEVSKLPFAIFLFGSFTRNLMLPNSDLDIGLVFAEDCPESIKSLLIKTITALPFADDVDVAHWDSIKGMLKENCPSLMEQNKAVEARFIVGSLAIAEQHETLVLARDSREEKEKRFITEYWLLHKFDYSHRSSKYGMNLKYDFGASKDIAFLDWYYLLNSIGETSSGNVSTAFLCFDLLAQRGEISVEECESLKSSLELILLVKFSLWDAESKSNDEASKLLLYLNDKSLEICFSNITDLLKAKGINNVDELTYAYSRAKGALHGLTAKLFEDVSANHEDSVELWKMAKDKIQLDEEIKKMLENPTWYELVPFAIRSESPEILSYMVKSLSNREGFEYILRIISQNKYITEEIKQDLLLSRLDRRIKAKLEDE